MKSSFKRKRSLYTKTGLFKSNEKLIILLFSFISGLVLGSLCLKSNDAIINSFIKAFTDDLYINLSHKSAANTLIIYLLPDFLVILLSSVLGLCVIGEPLIWMIMLIRGLGLGLSIGYIYSSYKLNGLAFCLIFIIIPATLSVLAAIICCKENILTSKEIRQRLLKNNGTNEKLNIKLFLLRIVLSLTTVMISAIIGCLLTSLLHGRFVLTG